MILMACFTSLCAWATPLDDIQKMVKEALCNGKVHGLSEIFDNDIEINIQENNRAKGKSRALPLLQNYVDRSRPYNLLITHKTERMQSGFLMGKLQTSNGQPQIHIMLKKGPSNNFIICQLRIED